MSVAFLTNQDVIEQVKTEREICSMVAYLRAELNLTKKLRLKELQVEIDRYTGAKSHINKFFIFKDIREDIADECNVEWVEPFITEDNWPQDWVEKKKGDITVRLNINYTPGACAEFQKKKEYSEKMMEEKKNGTYNEFTYKKYKV